MVPHLGVAVLHATYLHQAMAYATATNVENRFFGTGRPFPELIMQHRAQALKARNEGFSIPVRRVGDVDCETRKVRLQCADRGVARAVSPAGARDL